jgi:serine/threonine protein kinase/tetratricopeptide (TPR) repeat protein
LTTAPTDPLIGSTVSQYEIVAKLGGGGMGVVYRATDTKLGRTVALKFLPPQWSHDEGAKQRFLREAQAASATNHRNICVIHDIEQTADGRLFIVMAYYEGQTLRQRLEGGRLPLGDALDIASEVAEGLARAHAQGVIHRDIKPGNLIVSDDGVKILDFGLAKFADALQLTMPGSTIGTVAYMSPEQARGAEADARSDVWAVGVVLYEMLTGETPFKGTYPEAIFHAIKTEPVPPLRAGRPDIPEPVEGVVHRALAKDAADRYQSARELARDLRLLQGRTIPLDLRTEPLPPLDLSKALTRWQRVRRRVTLRRAAIAIVALTALTVGSYVWLTRPIARTPVAIAPVANNSGEPELDADRLALTASLIEELEGSPTIRVTPYRRLVEIIRPFIGAADVSGSEAIQAIATVSGARYVIVPRLVTRGNAWQATIELRSVETGANIATYETPVVASSLPRETAYRLITSVAGRIQDHFKTGRFGRPVHARPASSRFRSVEAARAFERGLNAYEQLEYAAALAALQQAASLDDQHAMTQAWLSRLSLLLSQRSEAAGAARRARQLVSPETPRREAAFVEAVLAESQNDLELAAERYRALISLAPDDTAPYVELADFLKRKDDQADAIEAYHAVLRLDAAYARPHVDLCDLYTRTDDHPLAERHARTAVEQYRKLRNKGGEAQALLCLGEVQREQGGVRLPEAKRNVTDARDIFESLGQPYNLARAFQYEGLIAYASGSLPDAVAAFGEALSRSQQVGNRQLQGLALMNLGATFEDLGHQPGPAIEHYRRSRDVFEQIGIERRAAEAAINAASVQVDYGRDPDDAVRRLASARATLQMLGYVDFEIDAMRVEAARYRYGGQLADARKHLLAARSLATERQLSSRAAWLALEIAETDLLSNDYDAARTALEDLVARETGTITIAAHLALAGALIRLGDFDAARRHVQPALADIERGTLGHLAAVAHTTAGELDIESGRRQDARKHFERAAALWTDDLPDAASVRAQSSLALLQAEIREDPSAASRAQRSIDQARRMGRLALEAECRLHLARIHLGQRRYEEALTVLSDVPLQGDRTIGPELQARVLHWRGRVIAERGLDRAAADADLDRARELIEALQARLPPSYRARFAVRVEIREVMSNVAVRGSRPTR